jgi:hypothetical protein
MKALPEHTLAHHTVSKGSRVWCSIVLWARSNPCSCKQASSIVCIARGVLASAAHIAAVPQVASSWLARAGRR